MTSQPLEMVVETVPASVARIRRFATDACRLSAPDADCDTVSLLVSEVATNALVHGVGQVRIRVVPQTEGVRIEVVDGSATLPRPRDAALLDEGGRGLALVAALASSWGSEPTGAGKTVWFEVGTEVGARPDA